MADVLHSPLRCGSIGLATTTRAAEPGVPQGIFSEFVRVRCSRSLDDAVRLMDEASNGVRPLVGGTDLIAQMKTGSCQPGLVMDTRRIPECSRLDDDDEGLHIDAAVARANHRPPGPVAGASACLEGRSAWSTR